MDHSAPAGAQRPGAAARALTFAAAVAASTLVGWLLWRAAAAGDADPYDSGTFWNGSLFAAFAIGIVVRRRAVSTVAAAALVVPGIGGTFELANETDSPFGPLGIVFLLLFVPVFGAAAWLGTDVRQRLPPRR